MCILSLVYHVLPDCPLFVFDNREEFYARPTATPRPCPGDEQRSAWLGGVDLVAGGTWLGVNEHALMIAATNRPKLSLPADLRSRGLLCRDLLECSTFESAVEFALSALKTGRYAGCNLAILSREAATIIESGDTLSSRSLEPGIHTVNNGPLGDADNPRVRRVQQELAALIRRKPAVDDWLAASPSICSLHADGSEPAVCLHADTYGTVSSSIVALSVDPRQARYLYAAGPPCSAPYADYSRELQSLLQQAPPKTGKPAGPV